jgi:hypothetical protein
MDQNEEMALSWRTHFISPLPIGGAARLYADPGEAMDAVRAILAPVAALDANLVPPEGVVADLGMVGPRWDASVWGAHGALKCAWFARSGATWVAGPVDDIALPFTLSVKFPVPLDWMVDRLQDYALACPPIASKTFTVSRSYPRNVSGWPMASVQLDDVSQDERVVNDSLDASKGARYGLTYSITCWCATPEERRAITPWLAGAMEALRLCAKFHPDIYDPSISLSESEDFQTLEIPAFLVTGRFSTTGFSCLVVTDSTTYGRVAVP